MESILQLKKANCKNCYKCIRNCPVKSIRVADHQANIIRDECILCGNCSVVCPQNAKQIRSDLEIAKALLAGGAPVVASIAPAFIADFDVPDLEACRQVFCSLGFEHAEETAIGAQIVKSEYEKMIAGGKHKVIISSCCHSANQLIEKYYPQALPYLAPVLSPMLTHAKLIKEQNAGAKVIFIGPCVSKKDEWESYGMVDCVLTFDELREWMAERNLTFSAAPRTSETTRRSRFFPTPGGIIKSMDKTDGFSYIPVDGAERCIAALKEIAQGRLTNCFIEMSVCEGSCIGGPAADRYSASPLTCAARVEAWAGSGKTDFSAAPPAPLAKSFTFQGVREARPGESQIVATLHKMGKFSAKDELNCGSCGYNTCREKAVAVCEGKADLSMCLPYLKEKAESFSDNIINNTPNAIMAMDEDLNIQQLNRAACALFGIENPRDIIGKPVFQILNPARYLQAIEDGAANFEEQYYLESYGRFVEEYIVYDKSYKIVISIMKDITQEHSDSQARAEQQQRTAEITDQIIEKQMRTVQEIASLLGETTAEAKIALTNLKETLTK